MIEINGKYTTAQVMIDDVEPECINQITTMVNHEAFTEPVVIMPDTHAGKGCVIGFTMPVGDKLVANVVGVDISCGMLAFDLGKIDIDHISLETQIRSIIPFGMNINKTPVMTFEKLYSYEYQTSKYSLKYFKDLCKRVDISEDYATRSIGTVGSGNHFIEFGRSEKNDNIWLTIHSGSRNLGKKICEYWQHMASKKLDPNAKISVEEIKETYPKNEWQARILEMKEATKKVKKNDLDWISGEDKEGYLKDMGFAREYAKLNRQEIAFQIIRLIDKEYLYQSSNTHIETIHNFIDLDDMIIRKGAIRSYEGEHMLIPLNPHDGILLCKGRSNPEWNFSAPHGAGRIMSRSRARREITDEMNTKAMNGVYSSGTPVDESPLVYKDSDLIEKLIEPTAEVIDRIKPFHNMKDQDDKEN